LVAFKVYHAIKQDYRSDIDMAISQGAYACVHERALEIIVYLIRQFGICELSSQAGSSTSHPANMIV